MHVTQAEIAELFGVSTRTVHRWGQKGLDETRTGPDQTYDVAMALAWRLEQEHQTGYDEGLRAAESSTKSVEMRKEEALARKRELEVGILEGRLIDVEEAEQDMAKELSGIRGAILSFPGRLAPRLDRYRVDEALAIVEPEVHQLMETLAEGRSGAEEAP